MTSSSELYTKSGEASGKRELQALSVKENNERSCGRGLHAHVELHEYEPVITGALLEGQGCSVWHLPHASATVIP